MVDEQFGRLARDDRSRAAAIETKRASKSRGKMLPSPMSLSISPDAQPSNREGCAGISTRSAASRADRISPVMRGGPSMTT